MTFKYNDVLISEYPYASVVKESFKKAICSFCFKENNQLLTCQQCKINGYCNKSCQRNDWKMHKIECKAFSSADTYPNDICLLLLRIMSRNKNKMNSEPVGIISNKYEFQPRCFDDLVSNLEVKDSIILNDFDLMVKIITDFLKPIGIEFNEFITIEDAKIVFAKSLTNNFEIQNDMHITIGYGCYLNGSGLNHSCWPNSVYHFEGNKLILQALKSINTNDSVFINYTDPLQLRVDRKLRLRQQYLFECQCEACCDDELEREMSQLFCTQPDCKGFSISVPNSDDYQCNKCRTIEHKEQTEIRHSMNKAKLFHLNNLMLKNDYKKALELSLLSLKDFNIENQPENSGGLHQLLFAEKAFESAIFLEEYYVALNLCLLKSQSQSWIHERLVRFLGTENHPIAKFHLEKFQKLLEYHN